ncbi:MAG TPA: endolytic transglycosylase MltG [Anaerolineales bacterium]|nr:endolytic transglycosylase MltG [Anaerolineales bacterium]
MKKPPKLTAAFFLIAIAALLIAGGFAVNYIAQIPIQAEILFGPPSIHLSTLQRYRIAYQLLENEQILRQPAPGLQTEFVFSIESGEPTASILARLQQNGAITSADLLSDYIMYTGLDTKLQAGDFYIQPHMNQLDVIHALLDSTPLFVPVAVLAGWRLEELAASLPTTGLAITPEEFIQAAQLSYNAIPISMEIPYGAPLEGFFSPGVYEVERTIRAEQLAAYLLEQFELNLPVDVRTGLEQHGLTLYQSVILASIIEREAVVDDEMPIIASVFYNRLAINMKLETDPTVQYALGYNSAQTTWWTNPLTYGDLEVDSPYNTYLYPGLPPTPIANPSLAALQAVAFPAQTPYYYFRAACDGSGRHNFSQTYQEHIDFACP